ncbi:hypothetical protein COU60_05435 [Candidatus Pacearchaeota archaeon CG10_big_fil_rev_8_21_14_0_10_34_76]|nr:MAG: hypothetical protein COU60_05435 [Candidatus Pacearchaeota archaeon CG10_big_fil_rev_8_21_14_0_10_34_76]
MSGSCRDLRDQMDNESVLDAFSALVSGGRPGYKTIIEKKVEVKKCSECLFILGGNEKFCPECGEKLATN